MSKKDNILSQTEKARENNATRSRYRRADKADSKAAVRMEIPQAGFVPEVRPAWGQILQVQTRKCIVEVIPRAGF